jgi:signal transduction histidine kinase/CheY-like chemotaxis protein
MIKCCLVTVALTLMAAAVRYILYWTIGWSLTETPYMLFFLVLLLSTLYGGSYCGLLSTDLLGKNIEILMPQPYASERRAKIIGTKGRELVARKIGGTFFPIDLSVSEFYADGQRFFTGRDITERKKMEDELKQKLIALANADRQKDDFLAMLSHELRNPLAPICNAVNIMKNMNINDANIIWCKRVIERQTNQLSRLVDDLLDVSRITQGKIILSKKPTDLRNIIERAVEASKPNIDAKNHFLHINLPKEPASVLGDDARSIQVISNILNNSAKYTQSGGHIWISLERMPTDTCIIRIRDNGMGIHSNVLPHIFELFTQERRALDRSEGGLGIGLTLVKKLVEMHGGTVSASSDGQSGSEFIIRLSKIENGTSEVSHQSVLSEIPGNIKALIVDDNRDSAESLGLLLTMLHNSVSIAYDGPQAIEAAKDFQPQIVFMDIGLPGMSGFEAGRKILEILPRTKVVAMTGYSTEEDKAFSKESGFFAHLIKPVDFSSINQIFKTIHEEREEKI